MKVLMTADAVGGVWTYALDLAQGLAHAGDQVVLAVMGPAPSQAQRAAAARVPGLVLEARPFRLEWMEAPWADVEVAGEWLLELERQHRPDIVHLNGYAHGAVKFRAPTVVVAHSCVLGWWEAVRGGSPPTEWDRYAHEVRAGLDGADRVVAPTVAMALSLRRHHGPLGDIEIIPNGRAPFCVQATKEHGYLWVGRVWDEAKGVALLDEAAGRGLPWRVDVVGDAAHPTGRPEARLAHLRPRGQVSTEELAAAFGRASVFVSTAVYEPFGLAALEAAQAGCALVLPRIDSLAETWDGAARFYRPGDAEALHEALVDVSVDEALRRRLAIRARAVASQRTHMRMAVLYRRLYEQMVATPWEVLASVS